MGIFMRKTFLAIAVSATALAVACGGTATKEASPSQVTQPRAVPTPTPLSTPISTPTIAETREPTQPPPTAAPSSTLSLQREFEDLSFSRLTNLIQAGERLYVTEQTGRVMTFPIGPDPTEATAFLDIRSQVSTAGNEEGLLGLAFDPDFESNGHFYVYYSVADPRRSVISRFTANAGPESELVVLTIPQPFQNHNGEQLAFGPDSMLYISLGDGGSGGDPRVNGQDPSTLLGSILRIDVSGLGPNQGYDIPPDNPFAGSKDARGEIWAYGLRNPWRFSFDRQNGDLWAGDVGQNSFEEVDLVRKGGNYGWNTLEGNHCFSPRTGCDASGTLPPVIEYGANKGCSVIGGFVYRGTGIPSLAGTYLYGDFCSGEVRRFRFQNNEATGDTLLIDSGLNITSFGQDRKGEIYVLTQRGRIYKLTADRR